MAPKKFWLLILVNISIILLNFIIFSNAFLGLSLTEGSTLSMTVAWFSIVASIFSFFKLNGKLLKKIDNYALMAKKMNNLDDCVAVFEDAIQNGDVFDKDILVNLEQIKRFKKKRNTIKELLLQKFLSKELTYQKFENVLNNVEEVLYLNMRSILSKIVAFDVEEYEAWQKNGSPKNKISEEKIKMYNEYINFVKNATQMNEEILFKLDKIIFEISRYNSIEDDEIKEFPAIIEIDELIKNAKLYK